MQPTATTPLLMPAQSVSPRRVITSAGSSRSVHSGHRRPSGPSSDMTPQRWTIVIVLVFFCGAVPVLFQQYAAQRAIVSLLTTAVEKGDMPTVKAMIASDKKLVNAHGYLGRTPLHWTAITGRLEMAKYLVSKQASITEKDEQGWLPVHDAVYYNQLPVVEYLVLKGTDLKVKDRSGGSLLHVAAANGALATGGYLIANKQDINAKDAAGNTPLHIATQHRQADFVNLLIRSGVDVNIQNNDAKTPLKVAHEMARNDDIIDVLIQNGGSD